PVTMILVVCSCLGACLVHQSPSCEFVAVDAKPLVKFPNFGSISFNEIEKLDVIWFRLHVFHCSPFTTFPCPKGFDVELDRRVKWLVSTPACNCSRIHDALVESVFSKLLYKLGLW